MVVGATIPGGIGLTQAILQRKWSVGDAESAAERGWEQEKRDRLFEAKRAAHMSFMDALSKGPIDASNLRRSGELSDAEGAERINFLSDLWHLHAQLQVYASRKAAAAAWDTILALRELLDGSDPGELEPQLMRFSKSRVIYIQMMRVDLRTDDPSVREDALKKETEAVHHWAQSLAQVDPQQRP